VVVVSRITGSAELKTGTGRLRCLPDEEAVAADVDKERTYLTIVHPAACCIQKCQHQGPV
jgi:hypothetical protein